MTNNKIALFLIPLLTLTSCLETEDERTAARLEQVNQLRSERAQQALEAERAWQRESEAAAVAVAAKIKANANAERWSRIKAEQAKPDFPKIDSTQFVSDGLLIFAVRGSGPFNFDAALNGWPIKPRGPEPFEPHALFEVQASEGDRIVFTVYFENFEGYTETYALNYGEMQNPGEQRLEALGLN